MEEKTENKKKVFIVDWDTCKYQTISAVIVADNAEEARNIAWRECNIPRSLSDKDVNVMEVSTEGESRYVTRFVE